MYQTQLSAEELDIILCSLNQAQARLRGMTLRQALLPMQYCARLSWEALYEARQILRSIPGSAFRSTRIQHSSQGERALSELSTITSSIERVMAQLQSIETNTDLSAMQTSVQSCLQQLNSVTTALKQSMLVLQS